ncbi:MAG TPA: glycosyl hydrolase-related protein [Gemmatimonadales bacterium]|nr:glycosyl hydrolase-related protein [Gemmatimonadales bacterium]
MPGLTFHLIPHTHWDREWYLTRAAFAARLVPALDDLLDRLDASPEFRSFLLDGQTVLLEDYLRIRPERRGRVATLVREGRLQVGPWYVLADEFVPSGESLLRNLLLGAADARRLGGRSDVLYSPDAFGHPAAWPALAAEFGIRFGVAWRGLGGDPDQHGDLYRWHAPDGRPVLLHHLPPDGYEAGSGLVDEPRRLVEAWARLRPALTRRAATSHIAVPVGADHHAAPAVARVRELLARLEPEADVRVSRLDEYFRAAAAAAEAGALPELRGELRTHGYTWTLQGVHATRAPLKRAHARAELWLERIAEPLAALALAAGRGDRRPILRDAWRMLVRSQFHDSISGCTSDAVARRVLARTEDAEQVAREVARASLEALAGHDPDLARDDPGQTAPRLVLWNPVPRPRAGTVVVADLTWFRRDVLVGPPGTRLPLVGAGARPASLMTAEGRIPLQPLGGSTAHERLDAPHHYPDQDEVDVRRVAFRAPALAGFGLGVLEPARDARPGLESGVRAGARSLDNGLIAILVGRDGSVTLSDLRTRMLYPALLRLESSGDVGDTYTFAPPARDRVRRMRGPVRVRPLAAGPLVGALEVMGAVVCARGRVDVRLVLTMHAGSPALRCTLEYDNQATDHRLVFRLPSGVAGAPAVVGGAFGAVERPATPPGGTGTPLETPVKTAPAQRFVAVAERSRGLALLAPGFFEYELTAAGDLRMTVLRAVGQLSRADLPTRPGHAGWPTPTPGAQCLGADRLQFAVAPVTGPALAAGTVLPELWEDVFLPPVAAWLRQATPLRAVASDIRLEGAGLVFSSMKPAEDGDALVLRCYNARAADAEGRWRLGRPVARAARVRADETRLDELRLEDGGRVIPFGAGPHEIVSVLVSPD